jgi:hypothetical protein
MDFRTVDAFTVSLMRPSGGAQKAAKPTAFDVQVNPDGSRISSRKLHNPGWMRGCGAACRDRIFSVLLD